MRKLKYFVACTVDGFIAAEDGSLDTFVNDRDELKAEALSEAAAGRLKPTIGQRFPLEQAAEAHPAVEARTTVGKILLIS